MTAPSGYYDKTTIDAAVERGEHRSVVGGLWDELGELQVDFLKSQGLQPHHRVLDIGCGSLRAGVKLVRFLDTGNYFGTDLNDSLLRAGYDVEISREGLTHKLPRANLAVDEEFKLPFEQAQFDFALAQSVFTHLPLNYLRICLERLSEIVAAEAKFFVTIFAVPQDHLTRVPCYHERGGFTSYGAKDPYHYRASDMEFVCRGLPWTCTYIGEWGHPRDQMMVQFTRSTLGGPNTSETGKRA
jgi:SAM-dependent methyltransferase